MTSTVKNIPANVKVSRVIPEGIIGKVLFWTSLPAALLLITIGIAFFNPCVWSYYLPFVAFGSLVACIRWRTTGLVGSYLVLISLLFLFSGRIPSEIKLWQMGVLFTLALDFFISLLAIEEIASLLHGFIHQAQDQLSQLHQSELKLIQLEQSQREEADRHQEEIQQLKEEAEQRRIEKHQNAKQLEYFESEIQMLTAQKEELISDTFTARALANERLHELEEIKKNYQVSEKEELREELSKRTLEVDRLRYELEEKSKYLQEALSGKNREIEDLNQKLLKASSLSNEFNKKSQENETFARELQDQLSAKKQEIEDLNQKLLKANSLSEEIDKKSQESEAITQTLQDQLLAKNQEIDDLNQKLLKANSLSGDLDTKSQENETFTQGLQDQLSEKNQEVQGLKEELQEVFSLRKEVDAKNQEVAILTQLLETVKHEKLSTQVVDPEETLEVKRQLAQVDGLYKQLRLQFEEKASILSQTRKELFQTQGKLLALEHHSQLEELDPDRSLEKEVVKLGAVVDELESEINLLEELIFHSQSR